MRVLQVHNFYGSTAPSGENQVVDLERTLLEAHGHEVETFARRSDDIRVNGVSGLVRGALSTPWNPWAAAAVRRVVRDFRPDVVHVHNTFPLISPSIFWSIPGCARVLTLHNYRLFCPAAIPLRGGRTCTACMEHRTVVPALLHACYRGSRLATVPLAAGVALHRAVGTWQRRVEAFIALTPFQRDLMVGSGLPRERVFVKPNFFPGRPTVLPWAERTDVVVFAGRLAEEKGVSHLIDAWRAWGASAPQLRIVGDGPLRGDLERRASASGRIVFLGQLTTSGAEAEIASAKLLVLPSIWFEGFPMVLREALAFGTPAAVSRVGSLPGIVEHGRTGIVFAAGDSAALLAAVRAAWHDPATLARMANEARREFERNYSEEANLSTLEMIYGSAIAARKATAA